MIDVNLRGLLHGIAAALPVFRRQGAGHFVNVKAAVREKAARIAIPREAIARAIVFAVEQPAEVDVGEVTVRPTAQD